MGPLLSLLVWLVEPLSLGASDSTATVAAALLAVAVVAIVHAGHSLGVVTPSLALATATSRRRAAPVTSDRVTDPVHHPLRPRAPGTR